jgi:hypothetical protein
MRRRFRDFQVGLVAGLSRHDAVVNLQIPKQRNPIPETVPGMLSATCILSNPLFMSYNPIDPAGGDYHLKLQPSISPSIDKGANPGTSPYDKVPILDYDGHTRPVDITDPNVPNYGSSAYTDMGAYEVQQ